MSQCESCKLYRSKLDKVASWLERLGNHSAQLASASKDFPSLQDAYCAEARNYNSTADDIRRLLEHLRGSNTTSGPGRNSAANRTGFGIWKAL